MPSAPYACAIGAEKTDRPQSGRARSAAVNPRVVRPRLRSRLPVRASCPCFHVSRRRADGLDDVFVAGAAAEVRGNDIDQFLAVEVRTFLQNTDREHQKARRTEAALQGVVPHERFLHRVQPFTLLQSFDGADAVTFRLHSEHQAGAYRFAIDENCAGAADAVLAADMRADLTAIVADNIDERATWLDGHRVVLAVDGESDRSALAHSAPSNARC